MRTARAAETAQSAVLSGSPMLEREVRGVDTPKTVVVDLVAAKQTQLATQAERRERRRNCRVTSVVVVVVRKVVGVFHESARSAARQAFSDRELSRRRDIWRGWRGWRRDGGAVVGPLTARLAQDEDARALCLVRAPFRRY